MVFLPLLLLVSGCGGDTIGGDPPRADDAGSRAGGDGPVVRVATFNIQELSAAKVDSLPAHPQLEAAAAIVKRVRPDILLLNEVDLARAGYGLDRRDPGAVVRRFRERYLATGPDSIDYPWIHVDESNTGILSGLDLNRDDVVAGPDDVGTRTHGDDAFGFGTYPGQYSMAVLSRFPLDTTAARSFRGFLWRDLPGHHMPVDFYGEAAVRRMRLSSKSHWDLPVAVDGDTIHLLASHPTPPVFDGPEDRNGRRNFDEIGFWSRYLDGSRDLYDDQGGRGGIEPGHPFIVLGDLNADPDGGEAVVDGTPAISQLLGHPRVRDPAPHRGHTTATFEGGVRVDYVLPSAGLEVVDGGVFAPSAEDDPEGAALAEAASDHRLVWLDVRLPGG